MSGTNYPHPSLQAKPSDAATRYCLSVSRVNWTFIALFGVLFVVTMGNAGRSAQVFLLIATLGGSALMLALSLIGVIFLPKANIRADVYLLGMGLISLPTFFFFDLLP